ncbi:hypothetical protein CH304_07130 [Rhodococcus sp. 15-649-1-2]|nr:hypothetical protein [Rhodococcus sp. 15-649-1-2]OZE84929.1 hypothetical protein CH304_07130 [Rhodococcus sp. 15-649-1-2]
MLFSHLRRLGTALAGGALAVGFMLAGAPTAAADTVTPFVVPQGVNMGQVTVATGVGGVLDVHITGRTDALTSAGQVSNGCLVYVNSESQFVPLDASGSGSTRFTGLSNGEYGVYGKCAHRDISAVTDLLATPDSSVASGFKSHASVLIDGTPTTFTAGGLTAPGSPQQNCAQTVSAAFNSVPPGAEWVAGQIKPILGRVETIFLGACGVLSIIISPNLGSDQNFFDSICLGLESALDPLGIGMVDDFFCGTPVS